MMKYALLSFYTTRGLENLSEWRKRLDESLRRHAFEVNLGTYIFDLNTDEAECITACSKLENHDCPFCVVRFTNPGNCLVATNKDSMKLSGMGLRNKAFPIERSATRLHDKEHVQHSGSGNGGQVFH